MDGTRRTVPGADGTSLGLLTAGDGAPLLLVHGGFGQIERWAPMWDLLRERWQVTAMDRRGRGSSGDSDRYAISQEYDDIRAVATDVAEEAGCEITVFAHSYGATCALGAARGAPIRQMALYEPAGPATVEAEWISRASALIAAGKAGPAMASFLTEIIGLSDEEVDALKASPAAYDILAVLTATLEREARALTTVDLPGEARQLPCPITLLLGDRSPPWASVITTAVAAASPTAEVVLLAGVGHEGIDRAPDLIVGHLSRLGNDNV